VNWIALVLAILSLAYCGLYLPSDRKLFAQLLKDFGTPPPRATEIVLNIPDLAFPITACAMAISLIFAQWLLRKRGGAAWLDGLVIIVCCVAVAAFRECMFMPIIALMRDVAPAH
jgi:hypothetical protein